jgi:hypothetical protein
MNKSRNKIDENTANSYGEIKNMMCPEESIEKYRMMEGINQTK